VPGASTLHDTATLRDRCYDRGVRRIAVVLLGLNGCNRIFGIDEIQRSGRDLATDRARAVINRRR